MYRKIAIDQPFKVLNGTDPTRSKNYGQGAQQRDQAERSC